MSKTFFRTLRFRLTLWNTIVVLIASVLALIVVREAMRLTIEGGARELLREESKELELAIDKLYPDQLRINEEFERKLLGHAQKRWFAALLQGDDQIVWKSSNFPQRPQESKDPEASESFAFHRTHDWLLVNHRITLSDGRRFQIILGEPIDFIRKEIWQLTRIMLMIGAAWLLIAPVGGYVLARSATRPVRQIIATTRSLDPAHLDSRLEIRGSGDELDQISTEINSFVDQISKYIKSQQEFVANAAHELRSPITAIQTSVEVTLNRQRTPAEYLESLETVSERCQELRHLVNQLLELAETDAAGHSRSFGSVNLSKLIEESINVFSGIADEKEITIVAQIEPGINIQGDGTKLRRVFNNLLDNALKFSPDGGEIVIGLNKDADSVWLTVEDYGPGVSEKHLAQIFERFFQIDPSRQRSDRRGNGLGLSICKSIVDHHGGKISAENSPNGLLVRVTLSAS